MRKAVLVAVTGFVVSTSSLALAAEADSGVKLSGDVTVKYEKDTKDGEANASGDENYDFSFISVTGGTNININASTHDSFLIEGSIFGSGNASSSTGSSIVNISNYGTFNNYKTNVEQLKQEIDKYIIYYNNERIKSNLNKMSPIKYRTHYYQN